MIRMIILPEDFFSNYDENHDFGARKKIVFDGTNTILLTEFNDEI